MFLQRSSLKMLRRSIFLTVGFESLSAHNKNTIAKRLWCIYGALEGTRTPDLLVRSQTLYPAELPAHMRSLLQPLVYNITFFGKMQVLKSNILYFFACFLLVFLSQSLPIFPILICNLSLHLARISECYTIIRNILCYHRA